MENKIRKLNKNKNKILPLLFDWADTFSPENIIYDTNTIDEEDEENMIEDYYSVLNLFERFESGNCDSNDYENIFFHISQINYNEIKIDIQ